MATDSSPRAKSTWVAPPGSSARSEEHTSELQSQSNLVCRLLLEKKKKFIERNSTHHNSTNSHIPTTVLCFKEAPHSALSPPRLRGTSKRLCSKHPTRLR